MNYEATDEENLRPDDHEAATNPSDHNTAIALSALANDLLEKIKEATSEHLEFAGKFESISKSITTQKNEADAFLIEQEGYTKTGKLAEELGVAPNMVSAQASLINPEVFGKIRVIGPAHYYSPDQKRMLIESFEKSAKHGSDWYHNRHENRENLENYKNRKELARHYNVPLSTMLYIINTTDKERLGEVEYVKPNRGRDGGAMYSLAQQEVIRERFEAWQRKNGKTIVRAASERTYEPL